MNNSSIKAKCRNCGCDAPAEQFKMHYEIRQMVCPKCFSGKAKKDEERRQVFEKPKPSGWDAEDDYLEKVSILRREENESQFSRIQGSSKVMCKCANCKYSFRYDPYKKMPRTCPSCDKDVPRLRMYNLL